jgi:hypothetical protein
MKIWKSLVVAMAAIPVIGIPAFIALGISIIIGWLMNLVFLASTLDTTLTIGTATIGLALRIVGVFFPPLGAAMAFFG